MRPSLTRVRRRGTHRLVPSRYPTVGILDAIAAPEDLAPVIELEGWTNDRISAELGLIHAIPKEEWVTGRANATVIMAAFCHPAPGGGRFNRPGRGAWYAAFHQGTAIRETVFHRTNELREIGVFETRVEMREYLADFDCDLHDVRASPDFDALHDPDDYGAGQALGAELLAAGSNGVRYRAVRDPGRECLACFRPRLVLNVRQGAHFEYVWHGDPQPTVSRVP